MDLDTRRPLIFRVGRGKSGGTTALNATAELGFMDGRKPIMLDAARNPGLALLYPTVGETEAPQPGKVKRPKSHTITDGVAAIRETINAMMEHEQGAEVDFGGGQDDAIVKLLQQLNIVEFGADVGIRPIFLVTFGPEMADFEHVLEIKSRGIFDGVDVILVQSAGAIMQEQDAEASFSDIMDRPEYAEWIASGAKSFYLPFLPHLNDIRKKKLTLRDAAADKVGSDGTRLGFTAAWETKAFLKKWRKEFSDAEIEGWMV